MSGGSRHQLCMMGIRGLLGAQRKDFRFEWEVGVDQRRCLGGVLENLLEK